MEADNLKICSGQVGDLGELIFSSSPKAEMLETQEESVFLPVRAWKQKNTGVTARGQSERIPSYSEDNFR